MFVGYVVGEETAEADVSLANEQHNFGLNETAVCEI